MGPAAYPPGAKKGRIVGLFRRREGGFGFVRPTGRRPGRSSFGRHLYRRRGRRRRLHGRYGRRRASQAARRTASRTPRDESSRSSERETHRFVGTYFEEAGTALVTIDGTVFSRPILVGDPGASDARPSDKVVVEMVRFPSHYQEGEGVIAEILGPRGKPGVDTLSIIREFDLPGEFPEDVLAEARAEAERLETVGPPGPATTRRPRRSLPSTRSMPAISTTPSPWSDWTTAAGGWASTSPTSPISSGRGRPWTARRGTAATSVYLPDRVIPMLPELISNGLASLQPGKVRFTKTVYMELTPEGLRTHVEFHDAAIQQRQAVDLRAGGRVPGRPGRLAAEAGREGPRSARCGCTSWR